MPRRRKSIALLTREEEHALALRWRDHRDEAALHKLVNAHIPIVRRIAKRYARKSIGMEDLIQEGSIGLIKAAERFEPDRNLRFVTYAQWWIKAQMKAAVFSAETVRPSQSVKAKQAFFQGKSATKVMSLETPVSPDGFTLGGTLVDTGSRPDEIAEGVIDSERLSSHLDRIVRRLKGRELAIFKARFLTEDAPTLDVLGKRFGVSKERIRQIERHAFETVQAAMLQAVPA